MENKRSYKKSRKKKSRKKSKRKRTTKNKRCNIKKYSRFKMNSSEPTLISSNELHPKPYLNYTNRTIFVFDFDMTLTTMHTQGNIDLNIRYFSQKQYINILKMFKDINRYNGKIIILSRGIQELIESYLFKIYNDLWILIDEIIGAKTAYDMTNFNELSWANKKADVLCVLYAKYINIKLAYFDDTILNINVARLRGFVSYVVSYDNSNNTTNVSDIVKSILAGNQEILRPKNVYYKDIKTYELSFLKQKTFQQPYERINQEPTLQFEKHHSEKEFFYHPYSEKEDLFYNMKNLNLKNPSESTYPLKKPIYIAYGIDSDYKYLVECIQYNDTESFINFIRENPEINIFSYFSDDKNSEGQTLLELAIQYKNQKIIDVIFELEKKYRERGKNTCYQIYSHKYLKLIESLSTPTKTVDFYIEEWLFKKSYNNESYGMSPMHIFYQENCFYNRKERNEKPCLYPNIRWQSGDPRHLIVNDFLINLEYITQYYLNNNKLDLNGLKENFKNVLPFLKLFTDKNGSVDFDLKTFLDQNILFKKEFNKQFDTELWFDLIKEYIEFSLKDSKLDYLKILLMVYETNKFSIDEKDSKLDYLKILLMVYETDETKFSIDENETTYFVYLITKCFYELLSLSTFITDVYTILRIFKEEVAIKPYFVYCYFGDTHIKNLLYFFTNIRNDYKIIIEKKSSKSRCIKFEPNEYIENSREIRQLSGPISFYKLQALDKETMPQYINLFGDKHKSEKEQCKECNFDYFNYYRHKYKKYIN
jgi:hypothetical protein